MEYELRDHTADVAVAATGETRDAVFGAVANGMAAAMCEEWPAAGETATIRVSAENPEALLFDYLDELIYERDVNEVLPVDNDPTIDREDDEWHIEATYRGVPLSAVDARDLKAVTYSEMELRETDEGWQAYVVFDV